jgi:hypothetical protein
MIGVFFVLLRPIRATQSAGGTLQCVVLLHAQARAAVHAPRYRRT